MNVCVVSFSLEQEMDLKKECSLLQGVDGFGLKQNHNPTWRRIWNNKTYYKSATKLGSFSNEFFFVFFEFLKIYFLLKNFYGFFNFSFFWVKKSIFCVFFWVSVCSHFSFCFFFSCLCLFVIFLFLVCLLFWLFWFLNFFQFLFK